MLEPWWYVVPVARIDMGARPSRPGGARYIQQTSSIVCRSTDHFALGVTFPGFVQLAFSFAATQFLACTCPGLLSLRATGR